MDFTHSERSQQLQAEVSTLPGRAGLPGRGRVSPSRNRPIAPPANRSRPRRCCGELKVEARRRGLWNLFLPDDRFGAGLSVLDYAPIAELSGRSVRIAPEAMNCAAPDTGNMELLAMFGTEAQHEQWLQPLLDGEIRSCFSMTEPDGGLLRRHQHRHHGSPRDGDSYVVNGRKWWSTGAMREECRLAIVMGVSDPDADRHARHSMILVPLDAPGVTVAALDHACSATTTARTAATAMISFDEVRVPAGNLLGPQGGGFAMAQARLGPGRIHHCMRSLGMAERALELMVDRAADRTAFGGPLARQGVIREWIAESRLAIEQARLLVLKTAWLIDTVGVKQAATEIAAIKVAAPRAASYVLDRAIQTFGAAGVSGDTPLAEMWAGLRTLHLADGPDEVHLRSVARVEIAWPSRQMSP